ncbi:SDR family NAD(P)-dependent oxidoreductase [Streptomyces sp. NPDC029674]|uniref:SDR family NAD(P)-dependent oxidoreductase n=1 Tax=Streptomyces sp. NPDC029674 TaxID=3365297 RepID=UPI00384F9360
MNVPESPAGTSLLWTLSGDSRGAIAAQARRLRDHLRTLPEWNPADIGLALAHATTVEGRRAALVAGEGEEFLDRLDALARGHGAPGLVEGPGGPGAGVAFVFPGQGSQWPGMAAELLDSAPGFRERVDACAQALEPFVDWSLIDVLRAADGAPALDRPDVVQPALFAVGVALAGLWRDHGVEPSAVIGHSCGEISAAAVSGALSLDDSARVVARWSQAQATLSGRGDMVSVMAPVADVRARLAEYDGQLGVAAVNGPSSVIVSGGTAAATELVARLTAEGVHARRIAVGLAAHSPQIDAIVPRLHSDLAPVRPLPADLPYYSGLTGDRLPAPVLDAAYWARNLRNTVRFDEATAALLRDGHHTLLEVSPHPVLTTALQATAAEQAVDAHIGATLRRGHGGRARFLTALGEAYAHGVDPDRTAVFAGLGARPAELPAGPRETDDDAGTEDPGAALRDELTRLTATGQRERLLRVVAQEAAAVLGDAGPVDPDATFTGLGADSVTAVEIRNRVAAVTGAGALPVTAVFDHPTPRELAEFLRDELLAGSAQGDRHAGRAGAEGRDTAVAGVAGVAAADDDPVAIVAMGCRYPGGADSPERLWQLLTDGTDAVTPFPDNRGWSTGDACAPEDVAPGRHYQREAGFLHEADRFDAAFFGISPREARVMDPQQRLLLETSWETFERAGLDPHTLRGSRTGVYIGAMTMDYGPRLHEATDGNGHLLTGNTGSVASGRIAYALGLEGAAVTVDTACSSSLVALHLAVQALRRGECALALAGGATVMPTPGMFVEFSSQGGLAADGRCKAFSAQADGFGLAEGVGVVLLERLSDARRNGHPVLAVVRGSAVNQDGASNGLTAPNGPSQQRVIRAALADAGLSAKDVDAVEAHGTGTTLGDPIEAQALLATYGQQRADGRPLWLGSLKSNIGHTQAAAGVGGVMKMVLAMRHGLLPRSLHITEPTPYVNWGTGDVRLLGEPTPWPENERPRRAGVSGFGISGTNAHVIVEQAPEGVAAEAACEPPADASEVRTPVPWVVSAKSPQALREQAARLLEACGAEVRIGDVGLSLAVTRSRFEHRAVVAGDREQLLDGVGALASGDPSPFVVEGRAEQLGGTVFVFPGQGAQWAGMARELLDESAEFAGFMGECEAALSPHVGWSLLDVVRSGEGLERVDVVQPVLFAVMVSLARLWRSFGVVPDAVVGHSQGEIAAAVVAGGLSLADGAKVVALRSRAIVRLAGQGGMVSLAVSSARAAELIEAWDGRLSVAAVNGPSVVVVSGDSDALAELLASCEAEGVRARRIDVDYASHSAHVERIEGELAEALAGIEPVQGDVPLLSTVTGEWLDTSVMDAAYWYRNLRGTVGFEAAVRTLAGAGYGAFVEVGPHPVLAMAVEQTLEAAGASGVVLGTLRRDEGGLRRMLLALGEAHAHGVPVDWSPAFAGTGAARTELPTYPFQRERFWLEPTEPAAGGTSGSGETDGLWEALVEAEPARLAETLRVTPEALHEVLPALSAWRAERTRERRVDSWRHRVGWRPLDLPPAPAPTERWLAVCPAEGPADDVVRGLVALGLDLTVVHTDGPGTSRAELAAALRSVAGGAPVAGDPPVGRDSRAAGGLSGAGSPVAGEPLAVGVPPAADAYADGYSRAAGGLPGAGRSPVAGEPPVVAASHAAEGPPVAGDSPTAGELSLAGEPPVLGESPVVARPPSAADPHADGDSGAVGQLSRAGESPVAGMPSVAEPHVAGGASRVGAPPVAGVPHADGEPYAAGETSRAGAAPVVGVLSLLADERRTHPEHPEVPGGVALTLSLVQALGDAGVDAPLWCVTRGAAVVGAGERPGAHAHAAVAGLGRCVALEHPDRWGGLVDLPHEPDERALRRLCAVLASVTDEDQVAVRSTGVQGRRLLPAPVRGDLAVPDEAFGDGTVLVTGGTGGVGAHVARWLGARGAGHLLLVGRRGPQAPGAEELRAELEGSGTAVSVVACDVADPERVAELVGTLPPDRPLTAVVHAAGVLDDGMLDALTPARLAKSLRAKVTAAEVLHEATAHLDLSAFVVFTSVMGVVGNAGQANYAAANAALESLVASRRAAGLPGTAVAWGAWAAGEGMLADGVAGRLRDRGLPSMDPEAAVTALGRALAEDDALVVVADADWRRLADATGPRTATLLAELTGRSDGAVGGQESEGAFREQVAAVPDAERARFVTDLVRTHAAAVLRHPDTDAVHPERAFTEMGFDSLTAVELRNRLAAVTGVRLPATVLFDRPTPAVLAGHLLSELGAPADTRATDETSAAQEGEPIAIVGMGCRFPGGVRRPAELWQLLTEGRDAVTDWPADRGWDTAGLYDPDPDRTGTTYCTQGAFVTGAADFDAEFFGISPREALAMDPQQRLLLETAWEAAEHAGQNPAALRGRRVGVFVGTNGQDYMGLAGADPAVSEGHLLTGNTASVMSGRISYVLGLEGPALTVDTACSSSLVAVHLAAQALRRGDCDQAFAGGATVMSTPRLFVEFSRQRGLARDGRCKAFGAGADGTAWGEGAGVLFLERLSDARRHGHRVLAVIRGSAVNQDGASNGLTAPNGPAQQTVIRAALADAGLRPHQVDAVEAHGTGTVLGDPIEAQALQAVYAGRPADRPLWLGSVKSNIGHTQAAAGVAGLMKTVLALGAGELPGTLHADEPNPHIDWSAGDVRLLTGPSMPWPETGEPRRAGVSSFGISGTNAHIVVEQAPPPAEAPATATHDTPDTGVAVPLLLSARTPDALRAQAAQLRTHLVRAYPGGHPARGLADVAHVLATRRAALDHRAAVLGHDPDAVLAALDALADGASAGRLVTGHAGAPGRTAFLFPGQGSQRPGAGAGLYRTEPAFADALDDVLTHLAPHLSPGLELPLRDVMFAAPGTEDAVLLDRTGCTQPALFALQVALFRLLEHWGVRPDVLLGHSIGELAAAHVAGVLDLPDACALVAARGRLMDALPGGGAMVAVEADEEEVRTLLAAGGGQVGAVPAPTGGEGVPSDAAGASSAAGAVSIAADAVSIAADAVSIAAVNGPRSTVLSGDRTPVLRLAEAFRARGRRTKELAVSHAFHSAHVEAMLDQFRSVARRMTYEPPRIPVVSNLTGERATAAELCDPEYWVRHVRSTVRFLDGARTLLAESTTSCLELGPAGVLSGLVEGCRTADDDCRAVPLLREGRTEAESLSGALAALHVRGVPVDWTAGTPAHTPPLDLPTYPFQHRRYWPASRPTRVADDPADAWTYRVTWRALPDPAPAPLTGTWLLVVPEAAAGAALAEACRGALAEHGADVSVVEVPEGADRSGLAARVPFGTNGVSGVLSLLGPLTGPEATLLLIQALGDAGADVPLWCVTTGAVAVDGSGPDHPEQAQVWGLGRVAALEHPRRWGGLVDLPERPDGTALRRLCALLSGTVRAPDGGCAEDQVAVRADGLHGRRLVREPAPGGPRQGAPEWTVRGTVLVTGGTGGLGAHVARRLARGGADHLVLTSRRGADAPGAAELVRELGASGTRTTVAACDVADRSALADLLDRIAADGDTVRAVFHAAGVTSDTRIADCTPAVLAEETAAKVRGTAHLDALLGDDLDAFVLFSSVSAVWGSAGQATYAAANAHLDAVAERRRAQGRPATCVAWGPWAGAGMAQGGTGAGLRRLGLVPMAPEAALDALWRALERDDSGIAVADMDWGRFAPAFRSSRESALFGDLPEAASETLSGAGSEVASGRAGGTEPDAAAARWRERLAALPGGAERHRALTEFVRTEAAAVLGHDSTEAVDAGRSFHDIGFDSLTAVELRNRLAAATGLTLPASTVFDHPTATALGEHLHTELTGVAPASQAAPTMSSSSSSSSSADEPLAVIGMACRFPGGVRSPEDLWDLVAGERDTIGPLPDDRGWPLDALYDPDPEREGTFYTSGGGFLDGAGDFDAEFFGISPREALAMDPQQRLLLETSWEALERAGLDPASLRGSQGGVYLGVAGQGYGAGPQDPAADVEGHLLSGTVTSVASGRIAYTLGTEGPAVTVETACSSSLVALHLAGQALRAGECSFALVGGAAVMASPDAFVEFSRQRGLSPDGRCRSFAEAADGTGWGEGVGVLVVERLSEARRQGHPVLAVVRGSAVNQDGASNGLTAPSGPAQERVLRRALATAGLTGGDVDLVEAHGTGTTLGDPIEAQALLAVYGQDRPVEQPLWLGSLKSNIGHTQAAAGVAGVIKTVMALRHGLLPRTLHVDTPTTKVDWSKGAVRLLTEARPWHDTGRPRRAGVSSFGMSGTNAHAVLEQAPSDSPSTVPPGPRPPAPVASTEPSASPESSASPAPLAPTALEPFTGAPVALPLSAASATALRAQARRLREHVEAEPERPLADLAHALATTRTAFRHRAAVTGRTRQELLGALAALGDGAPAPGAVTGRAGEARTVFVFPGQGSQWAGMARELLDGSPVFAARIDACERALAPYVDWSLDAVLRGSDGAPSLERVDVVQPVLFAVMVSLAEVWRSYGVEPAAVVGHSQGEIAAACVAGALSLEDAARVVALRSRELLRLAGRGGMVSLAAPEERVREMLLPYDERIGVAGVNGPQAVVVAGEPAALEGLLADCAREAVRARRLPVDYAAHSAQVTDVGDALRTALAGVRPRTPDVPLYSTVTGDVVDGAVLDAAYWYRNLREPVEFARATETLLAAGHDLFIEMSPHPVLTAAIADTAERARRPVAAVGSVRRDDGGTDRLLASLAEAWTHGAAVDWAAVLPPPTGTHVPLPTYPFQHERYWLPTPGRTAGTATAKAAAPEPVAGPVPETDPANELAARLAPLDETDRRRTLLDLVVTHAAALLGHSGTTAVDPERPFTDAGFDSMLAMTFRNRLGEATGIALPPTTVFDHPTPAALAAHIDQRLAAPSEPERPVLAQLDRLADALAGAGTDTPDADEIGARLRDLLRSWNSRRPRDDCDGGAEGADTTTATADELFELLDNNYGA